MRNHLYRIAQEAMQNALKHSGAKNIDIELWSRPGDLRLSVIDDGQGIGDRTREALRVWACERCVFEPVQSAAELSITRGANGGNSVVCDVPIKSVFFATA